MKAIVRAAMFAAAALALTACETVSSLPYQPSTQNVIAAQSRLGEANVSVGAFTAAPGVEAPTCRAMGALDVAPGKTIPAFIRDALEAELFMADAIAAGAPAITGSVDRVDLNSFGTGSWSLAMTVRSPNLPGGYQVSVDYSFATSWSAAMACQNAATAFNPAVQALLGQVVNHPQFARLVGAQ